MGELADACKEYGLKLGLYLSPWDRNHADYGKPEYLDYFRNQLRELMTNYGEVFEVWFDGANGGTGYYGGANEERRIDRKSYYDWENTRNIVRELQPMACMFSDAGPDVRWVGNEEGWAMETNWAIIRRDEFYPGSPNYKELRSGHEDGTHWVPAEVDVSIRPGWYYHKAEDHRVKTLPQLLDIYYNSIGRNASFLLNFPVDTRGLIHEKDAEQVLKLAAAIKVDFEVNLAMGKKAVATNTRGNAKKYKPGSLTDGNPETYWATDDSVTSASFTVQLGNQTEFNRLMIQENIHLGQRVRKFTVEAFAEDQWKEIASQTTIGRKRILRFPNVTANAVRLNILDSKACPVISNFEIYKAPKLMVEPDIIRDKSGLVSIKTFDTGLDVFYTIDGTEPGKQSDIYNGPFHVKEKSVLKAIVIDPVTGNVSGIVKSVLDVCHEKWKVQGVYEKQDRSIAAIDENPESSFLLDKKLPADFVVDLGEPLKIKGFTYIPNQSRWSPGYIFNYQFYVGNDGKKWGEPVSVGEFSNIENSPVLQTREFETVVGRYIKLTAISVKGDGERPGIAELGIISK